MEFFFFVPFLWLIYVLVSGTDDKTINQMEKTLFKLNHLDSFNSLETLEVLSKMQDMLLDEKKMLFKRDEQSLYGFYLHDLEKKILVKVNQKSDDLFFDVYYDGKHFLSSDYDLVHGNIHNLQTISNNHFHVEIARNFIDKCAEKVKEAKETFIDDNEVFLFDVLKELVHKNDSFLFEAQENKKVFKYELLSVIYYETSKYQSTQLLWNEMPIATSKFLIDDNKFEIRFSNSEQLTENHKFYIQLLFDKLNDFLSSKKAALEPSKDVVLLDKEILRKTNEIILTIQDIEAKNPNMNKAQKYMLDRIKNDEIFNLIQNYSKLSEEERKKKLPVMLESLDNILNQLKEISALEGLENLNAFQKSALIIKKRYKKK